MTSHQDPQPISPSDARATFGLPAGWSDEAVEVYLIIQRLYALTSPEASTHD